MRFEFETFAGIVFLICMIIITLAVMHMAWQVP